MTCSTPHIPTFCHTLITGGEKYISDSPLLTQKIDETEIVTLQEKVILPIKPSETVRIETIGREGKSIWANYYFEHGGEVEGPARIISLGSKTRNTIKWGNYKSDLWESFLYAAFFSSAIFLLLLVTTAVSDIFNDVRPGTYPFYVFTGLAFLSMMFIIRSMVIGIERALSFSGKTGYKEKLVARFCTFTPVDATE
jgi:hypothetical protein